MANPWNRSGATAFTNGPSGTGTDVLSTLPAGQAKGLGSVAASPATPPSGDYEAGAITITIGPTTGGTINLYLLTSTDGTHWAGGIDPTSTNDQFPALGLALAADQNLAPIESLQIPTSSASATYAFRPFFLLAQLGGVPTYWAPLISNRTDAAFTASNALYRQDTYA